MYDDVCSDLDFPMCLEVDQSVDDMAILSCRGVRSDRRECAELARRLGLTANAAMLTAYRMGLSAMMDALIALEGKLDGN